MKILVVDDEALARERLQRLVAKLYPQAQVLDASGGAGALRIVAELQPDLVLLDIRMPGLDGMAVAERLQQLERPPAVVFCTAYDRYALAALERQASAYLLKPVREEKLRAAIEGAARANRLQLSGIRSLEGGRRNYVSAATHRGVEQVPVSEVRCFLADHKYVSVIFPGGELLVAEALRDLETEFSGQFIRVHRNALVNLDHVSGLRRVHEGWQIELAEVSRRPAVSRRYLAQVKQRLRRR